MIVVRPDSSVVPGVLMERVVQHVLRQHGEVEVKRLSREADREREVRFAIASRTGARELVQVEAHAAEIDRGVPLSASIALIGADRKPTAFQRELAELLAGMYGGFQWEPDPRETERLVLPSVEAMRDRRRGVRRSTPVGTGALTPDGRHELRDLSAGGLSFFASRPYGKGELIPVELELQGGQLAELLVRIRWNTAPVDGLHPHGGEIVALREQDRQALDLYLAAIDRGGRSA